MTDTTTSEERTDAQKRRDAYTEATQALREMHPKDFQGLYATALETRGLKHTPRLSQEQKDEAEFKRLLAEHPEFAQLAKSAKPAY